MSCAKLVKQINQKDDHTFSICWSDGKSGDYRLSVLQAQCPCAGCSVRPKEGFSSAKPIDPAVRAVRIYNVGRYGLRIQFTSGCSAGIYSFDMLYHLIQSTHTE